MNSSSAHIIWLVPPILIQCFIHSWWGSWNSCIWPCSLDKYSSSPQRPILNERDRHVKKPSKSNKKPPWQYEFSLYSSCKSVNVRDFFFPSDFALLVLTNLSGRMGHFLNNLSGPEPMVSSTKSHPADPFHVKTLRHSGALSFTVSPRHIQYYCQSSQTVRLLISFAFLACSSWSYWDHWRTSFPYLNRICISQASLTAFLLNVAFWRFALTFLPRTLTKEHCGLRMSFALLA